MAVSTLHEINTQMVKMCFNILNHILPERWSKQKQVIYYPTNDRESHFADFLRQRDTDKVVFPFAAVVRSGEIEVPTGFQSAYKTRSTFYEEGSDRGIRVRPVTIGYSYVLYENHQKHLEDFVDSFYLDIWSAKLKVEYFSKALDLTNTISAVFSDQPSYSEQPGFSERTESPGNVYAMEVPVLVDTVLGRSSVVKPVRSILYDARISKIERDFSGVRAGEAKPGYSLNNRASAGRLTLDVLGGKVAEGGAELDYSEVLAEITTEVRVRTDDNDNVVLIKALTAKDFKIADTQFSFDQITVSGQQWGVKFSPDKPLPRSVWAVEIAGKTCTLETATLSGGAYNWRGLPDVSDGDALTVRILGLPDIVMREYSRHVLSSGTLDDSPVAYMGFDSTLEEQLGSIDGWNKVAPRNYMKHGRVRLPDWAKSQVFWIDACYFRSDNRTNNGEILILLSSVSKGSNAVTPMTLEEMTLLKDKGDVWAFHVGKTPLELTRAEVASYKDHRGMLRFLGRNPFFEELLVADEAV